MTCNWKKEDYFSLLIAKDKKAHDALEMLVDDLHTEKDATILTFLSHSGAEDFLWGLSNLLGCENPRVAGNSAYIIGTLAESDLGCHRILGLAKGSHSESKKILSDLTRMLTFEDAESVMNAAGTMGTLAESHEGREWMLSEDCLDDTITHVTALLHTENLWTASNAALVLARLSISENGCSRILKHQNAQHILTKLVQSLGVDEAGRGMNAAFAIGRLCDMELGRKSLLQLNDSERMLSSLAKMLSCNDTGASKNACFALSCLATNTEGHTRLLNNIHSDDILRTLSELLSAEDSETGWFAAMTLRTLASQPRGCLRLRDHPQVIPALKSIERKTDVNSDLKEEATTTLDVLKKLEKPPPPFIELLDGNVVRISWDPISTKSGLTVRYQVYDCSKCVYTGKENFIDIKGLQPCTQYTYKLRAYTEGDESPFSDSVSLTTEEAVPLAPENFRVLGCTITQLKVGWDPPHEMNGTLKGYYVYQGDKMVEHTHEMCSIITGLQASTSYEVSVCASTSKGKGEKAVIMGTTADIGAHAPSKPMVQVLGRNEIHISWHPPEVPLGRITRYDVIMNNKVIYSGTDLSYTVRRLTPDTEYTIVVVALTNEGKFDSKPTKKRTSKDEFDSNRPPLYQPPRKESIDEELKPPPPVTQKKKRASLTGVESKSRSSSAKRSNTPKDHGKSPGDDVKSLTRPTSASSSMSSSGAPTPAIVNHTNNTDIEHMVRDLSPNYKTSPDIKKENQHHPPPPAVPKTKSPGLSVHFKEPHHSSHKKPQKPEIPAVNNKMFPVSMSYVSIQGGDREEVMASSHSNDQENLKRETTRAGIDSANSVLKMQRSRTLIHSGRTNLRTHPLNESFNNSQTRSVQDVNLTPSAVSLDTANKNKQLKPKPIINDLPVKSVKNPSPVSENDLTTVNDTNKSSEHTSTHRPHKSSANKSHHAYNETGDKNIKTIEKINNQSEHPKSIKETFLPKPSLPSQQYLESGGTNWGSRTLPSPRSSYEFDKSLDKADPEWLTKRFLELQYSNRGGAPHLNNHLSPSGHPGDCSYFLDLQQSVYHRTNTYVNSHSEKSDLTVSEKNELMDDFDEDWYPLPPIPKKFIRPSGKRTLERLKQQANVGTSNSMPLINNFSPDFSDNKSGMAQWNSKFIPMQLRTQPSNLAPSQLQRVNTTLGEPKGVQFKRVEAITRSQTLMDVRGPQGGMTLAEQAELYPVNMASVSQRSSAKDRTSVSASRSARGSNLVRTSASRHREPDSMLLQKSWSVSASREGNLQSAR